jgi:hypothetical protein
MLYDAPCMQGRLQVLDDGTLRVQAPFGRIVWQASQKLLTGLTTQPGPIGSLNVTFHTQAGTYEAKMVTQANFAKLQPYFSPPQQMAQSQRPLYAPYGGPPPPSQQPIQQQPGPYAPYGQPLTSPPPMMPVPPPTAKKQSHKKVWIVVSIIAALLVLVGIISNTGNSSPSQNSTSSAPTEQPAATVGTSAPTAPPVHYPPTTRDDLHGLAARGDVSAIHEFHSESTGITGACPQPKREVTVDPGLTGRPLAEDLLAYFYSQQLDSPCGSIVFAYHAKSEADNGYTAGRIVVDVTDANGAGNVDPNATNLKYTLTLDVGGFDSNKEYVVTY